MCKRLLVTALVLLFSRSIAATEFGPAGIAHAAVPINATLGNIAVTPAEWPLEVYPLPPTLPSLLPGWRSALQSALLQAHIFRGGAGPLPLSVKVREIALWGNTLQVFARYKLGDPAAPFFQTDVMSDAGVTSTDNGLPILDYSSRATQNRQQVEEVVRLNIAEFINRLEAFTAAQADRTAQILPSGI